jgi:hypothetical protein
MYKVLVLGGTHEREKEFSYPVIDMLVQQLARGKAPIQIPTGEDGARRAELWDINEYLAVAKVIKTGALSAEFVKQLSAESRRWQVAELLHSWFKPDNCYEPAHTYKGIPQWTSVHRPLFHASSADFYIDLHSFHEQTFGRSGTSMQINSYAAESFHPLMSEALRAAQHSEPQVYGNGELQLLDNLHRKRRDFISAYIRKHLDTLITLDAQLRLLVTDPRELERLEMQGFKRSLSHLEDEAESLLEEQRVSNWGNNWHFTAFGGKEPNVPDYFLFEAVTWGLKQQQATARFITEYLLPTLGAPKQLSLGLSPSTR